MRKTKDLGQVLVEEGLITREQLDQALLLVLVEVARSGEHTQAGAGAEVPVGDDPHHDHQVTGSSAAP
jgi:hypothetical protein